MMIIFQMDDSQSIKKRKLATDSEADHDGGDENNAALCFGGNTSNFVTGCKPLPFTCICYDGQFYTTDNCGHFIHTRARENKLMRCEVDEESQEVRYTFIRSLTETEVTNIENIEDVNVHTDLTSVDRSFY